MSQRINSDHWTTVARVGVVLGLMGCRGLVTVPAPIAVVTNASLNTSTTALQTYYYARTQVYGALVEQGGVIASGELLTDELTNDGADQADWEINARTQSAGNEPADEAASLVMQTRAALLATVNLLQATVTGPDLARVGEAYALMGYEELFMAEDYCAGVPLSQILTQGGVVYGTPLTTDSLLGAAEAHFDSALRYVGSPVNDTIVNLANMGFGRAALDRGNYAVADSAVANVPTGFVYNLIGETSGQEVFQPTFYEAAQNSNYGTCFYFNVANNKGGTGLSFVTAADPRLVINPSLFYTCDYENYPGYGFPDSLVYYPMKFGTPAPYIPLATGIEARLIQAEADWHTTGASAWASDLNALRSDAAETGVTFATLLPTDSTTSGSSAVQVAVMFRERAFWLFGTGSRLGDLRRLLRQYGTADGFSANTVFPSGPYEYTNTPIYENFYEQEGLVYPQNYGTDVSLLLPTAQGGATDPNPSYVGCLTSTATP